MTRTVKWAQWCTRISGTLSHQTRQHVIVSGFEPCAHASVGAMPMMPDDDDDNDDEDDGDIEYVATRNLMVTHTLAE